VWAVWAHEAAERVWALRFPWLPLPGCLAMAASVLHSQLVIASAPLSPDLVDQLGGIRKLLFNRGWFRRSRVRICLSTGRLVWCLALSLRMRVHRAVVAPSRPASPSRLEATHPKSSVRNLPQPGSRKLHRPWACRTCSGRADHALASHLFAARHDCRRPPWKISSSTVS